MTTITQDVEDFLDSDYGKAVVTNSSIQILLKQSPAAVDRIQKVFYLTEGEKTYLLSAGIGEGLFFAGANHVAMQVVASENEHRLITTNPLETLSQDQKSFSNFDPNQQLREQVEQQKNAPQQLAEQKDFNQSL